MKDINSLLTCQLLDEKEQDLKSLKDYKESLDYILLNFPTYKSYLDKYIVPFPADWPGWYYPKKLIANNNSNSYTSFIPEQGQFHVALNAIQDVTIIFHKP